MSVVIVGGHDRMVAQYKKICKNYQCKVKVFTQMRADNGTDPVCKSKRNKKNKMQRSKMRLQ